MDLSTIRLLGDQILVKNLGTADREGLIWIPQSAQEGRKIHQSGGDYLHMGEVVLVGQGDKLLPFYCSESGCFDAKRPIEWRLEHKVFDFSKNEMNPVRIASNPRCPNDFCQKPMTLVESAAPRYTTLAAKVGDTVLYERRRDAMLQPRRFPSLSHLDEDSYLILREEQHVLAILDRKEEQAAAA